MNKKTMKLVVFILATLMFAGAIFSAVYSIKQSKELEANRLRLEQEFERQKREELKEEQLKEKEEVKEEPLETDEIEEEVEVETIKE